MNDNYDYSTIDYRLSRIEDTLNEMKGLMTEIRLQARDIKDLQSDMEENRKAINAHDKRIRILEVTPIQNSAKKWEYIIDYIWKFALTAAIAYFAHRVGIA